MEDLKIALSRRIEKGGEFTDAGNPQEVCTGNAKRHAVVFSVISNTGAKLRIILGGSTGPVIAEIFDGGPLLPFVMDVTTFGQAVQGSIWFGGSGSNIVVNVCEIVSDINPTALKVGGK